MIFKRPPWSENSVLTNSISNRDRIIKGKTENQDDDGQDDQRTAAQICIRSRNTKPEMIVRKFLFSHGFRYRLFDSRLPGQHPQCPGIPPL